jgi:hypothetical protein
MAERSSSTLGADTTRTAAAKTACYLLQSYPRWMYGIRRGCGLLTDRHVHNLFASINPLIQGLVGTNVAMEMR